MNAVESRTNEAFDPSIPLHFIEATCYLQIHPDAGQGLQPCPKRFARVVIFVLRGKLANGATTCPIRLNYLLLFFR